MIKTHCVIEHRHTSMSDNRRGQRGVSLVESLVALVVLSAGMLGIAALYVETMRANRNALTRMHAIELVNDMADRIRANPRARASYDMSAYGGAPALRDCVGANNCTTENLAEDDLARWVQTVNAALPSASLRNVQVTPVVGGLDSYLIRLEWSEPGETNALSYENVFELIPVIP